MVLLIGITARAWGLSALALMAASAGMAALTASNSTTSLLRMGLAAGVLSGYAAAIALLVTPRARRTRTRCLLWGGTVPVGVAVATGLLAGLAGGAVAGLLASAPWLTGVALAGLLGDRLPALPLPRFRRRDRYPEPY